jgi:hypothetical protein
MRWKLDQMELRPRNFFIFYNADTSSVNVLYRRGWHLRPDRTGYRLILLEINHEGVLAAVGRFQNPFLILKRMTELIDLTSLSVYR